MFCVIDKLGPENTKVSEGAMYNKRKKIQQQYRHKVGCKMVLFFFFVNDALTRCKQLIKKNEELTDDSKEKE